MLFISEPINKYLIININFRFFFQTINERSQEANFPCYKQKTNDNKNTQNAELTGAMPNAS